MNKLWILATAALFFCNSIASAREIAGLNPGKLGSTQKLAADCVPASSSVDLNINNIRARLQNGGDMWWDLNNDAKYEVPKSLEGAPENASSLFAGAIWIGGIDETGQLKVAAQTYRQTGNDFFPGPLDELASIDAATCKAWDKHYQVYGEEIDSVISMFEKYGSNIPFNLIPQNLVNWPGYGNPNNALVGNRNMAPFQDVDANGYYDPTGGDYPIIDDAPICGKDKVTYADQMIWWVYNDKGNIHSETGATAIGMEVQALAFGFKTNDEVNDMTFYKYRLLNKATSPIDSVFMGQWIDPDLGCAFDDYIGCDLETGMGIVYNSSAVDGGSGCVLDYGNQPPFLGVDYFQGPLDENGIELGLSSFLYYNNDFSQLGNPENASDYYGYLSGTWKDGTPFTDGGDAYGGSVPTKYVFPGDPTDPAAWSECSQNDQAADRRIIQSSGPFRLEPGAKNDIVVGIVWVQPPIGTYPCPSFKLLKQADEKAQALFDACFRLTDGPPAPDIVITELDKELILSLGGTKEIESFKEVDSRIVALGTPDSFFTYQGYQIYQLVDGNVSAQDYDDPAKSRLIFQCDVKDNISKIVNIVYDPSLDVGNPNNANVPTLKVDGTNQGIKHTFQILNDAFATGDKRLINHKTYYFSMVSYAHNYYQVSDTVFDEDGNVVNISTIEQLQPYLAGRKNIKIYSAIPHITTPEGGGLVLNSGYGDGPQLQRQEGTGNGIFLTDLTAESVTDILNSPTNQTYHQLYVGGAGPVQVKVYNPKVVPSADFELSLFDTAGTTGILNGTSTKWTLKNLTTGEQIQSDFTIDAENEQLIPDWGLSVFVRTARNPGGPVATQLENNNGLISATITYQDPQNTWLGGLPDQEGDGVGNWIRSGTYAPDASPFGDYLGRDDGEFYEKMIDRTWTAYGMATDEKTIGPAWTDASHYSTLNQLDSLVSVDIVFTSDKSKWSQCIVVELQPDEQLSQGDASKFDMRDTPSRDKDGNTITGEKGRSWFPGYAINPETGERLNIFFGEDSWLLGQNGGDMLWNPTTDIYSPTFNELWVGGKHYVYVTRSKYDSCKTFQQYLISGTSLDKRNVYKKVCWVSMPLLNPGFSFNSLDDGLIPTTTSLKFRVTKPYKVYNTDDVQNGGMPRYTFNTDNIAAKIGDLPTAVNALDTIGIVPNPYYAYATYEQSQIDNRVKITNLPQKCTISIFGLDGTLIRKVNRDDASVTSYDWDLKNDAGIPIASGLYIIHINAPGIGERTLKWFGVLRPTDLDSY